MIVDELSPELEELLDKWAAASKKIKTLQGEHSRSVYNLVFNVEKVSKGRFFLETPDKGRIDIQAFKVPKDYESNHKDKETKIPFAVESDLSQRWICSGVEIYEINDTEKNYFVNELPKELRGTNIVHTPLPFLFGMESDEAKRRFDLRLLTDSEKSAMIEAIPRTAADRENYKKATIILDKKRFLPTAVKLIDPAGLETVYKFENVIVNDRNPVAWFKDFFGSDPYHPNLKSYKQVLESDVQPVSNSVIDGKNSPKPPKAAVPPKRGSAEPQPTQKTQPRTTTPAATTKMK